MSESKDVLFINATWEFGMNFSPPLSLGYLQAVLENQNLETLLFDAGKYWLDKSHSDYVAEVVSKVNPHIVGISSMDHQLEDAIEFSKKIKENDKDIIVCMGGYGPTFQYERCLNESGCDFVVRGEAEKTVEKLFQKIIGGKYDEIYKSRGVAYKRDGRIFLNPDQELVYDLDSLPFPLRRDLKTRDYEIPEILLENNRGPLGNAIKNMRQRLGKGLPFLKASGIYNIPIMSSRGCSWGKCKFCNGAKFPGGEAYRVRSNESMIRELKEVNDEGLGVVTDQSACFLGGKPEQMGDFLDLFNQNFEEAYLDFMIRSDSLLDSRESIRKHMDKIYRIAIGIESFSEDFLKRNVKGVSSKTNREAVTFLEELREKRGTDGIYYPTLYMPMTIDCDGQTTIKEFKEHYGRIKSLGILKFWEPNHMKYHPWTSWKQQDEIWEKDVIDSIAKNEDYWVVSTKFEEDKLEERAEKLRRIFDPLVRKVG